MAAPHQQDDSRRPEVEQVSSVHGADEKIVDAIAEKLALFAKACSPEGETVDQEDMGKFEKISAAMLADPEVVDLLTVEPNSMESERAQGTDSLASQNNPDEGNGESIACTTREQVANRFHPFMFAWYDRIQYTRNPEVIEGHKNYVALPDGNGHIKRYPVCIIYVNGFKARGFYITSKRGTGFASVEDGDLRNFVPISSEDGAVIEDDGLITLRTQGTAIPIKPGSMACLEEVVLDLRDPIFPMDGTLTDESKAMVCDLILANAHTKHCMREILDTTASPSRLDDDFRTERFHAGSGQDDAAVILDKRISRRVEAIMQRKAARVAFSSPPSTPGTSGRKNMRRRNSAPGTGNPRPSRHTRDSAPQTSTRKQATGNRIQKASSGNRKQSPKTKLTAALLKQQLKGGIAKDHDRSYGLRSPNTTGRENHSTSTCRGLRADFEGLKHTPSSSSHPDDPENQRKGRQDDEVIEKMSSSY